MSRPGGTLAHLVAIDDEPAILEFLETTLAQEGLEIHTATDPIEGLKLVSRIRPQIVLLDLNLPGMSGMEVLQRIVEHDPTIEVILVTGDYSTDSAVVAIQKGASDYMTKPIDVEKLRAKVDGLILEGMKVRDALGGGSDFSESCPFQRMVGRSPRMLQMYTRIRRVAPHFRAALVTGPTGTGKELVARALHQLGPQPSGPFAVCNCAAVVETLFESELFGSVKGAFTGATQDRVGLFEYADGGTLLLDEIGEMPLQTQAKLLRVLQTQEVQRVGSPVTRAVNVRVVAATNRNLRSLAAGNRFREDLYYRLSMVEIQVPPLSDRMEDLPLLERHFLEHFASLYKKPIATLTRRAKAVLERHTWPGNVREMENVFGLACMMADGKTIDVGELPTYLSKPETQANSDDESMSSLEELSQRHASRVVERVGGNKAQAAEILGISRATLYRLLKGSTDQKRAA